ncbi:MULTISPECIES: hypothetical protein [Micromonospora]|uniref:Uncharacterized protein n=1 Tax=Micromonospora sicca TaxID=2202420 RepID=A0A317DE66_9ACTN|nr:MULTISPECIES: hypothetical protein [unclassified Micromonospora]MBM0225349.1 hypothetical protein [Micromonospora sp. ATA51]PWR12947.1 hypothetical protein DKT69_22490 [Micromonospora sp. 4G51]
MSDEPGLALPAYFSYYRSPVKMVATAEGGLTAWRLSIDTGGWEPVTHLADEILFAIGGEVSVLTADQFVQRTEHDRGRYLEGEGPVFALYETVQAIEDSAAAERRHLTAREQALISGIRRRTFVMFEEELQRAGDPGADPTIADSQA